MNLTMPLKSILKYLAFFACTSLFLFLPVFISYGDIEGLFDNRTRLKEENQVFSDSIQMIIEGRKTFRYDTFGDEAFWGATLKLHEAIAKVSPKTALGVGLKVDLQALPKSLQRQLKQGKVDLDDPATTLALLKLNGVIGVTGFFSSNDDLISIGIQCALCHSTVDDSFAPGIGNRLDGWANQDLNVGAIIGLAPDLSFFTNLLGLDDENVRKVLNGWGPGKFDAHLLLDGKNAPTLIPPAFGLAGVNLHTWTGWGSVTHWNAFVAVLEMGGRGTFYDPRLRDETKFPIAARNGFYNIRRSPDLVTKKLAALQFYQLALKAPKAPRGSFDKDAARKGETVFNTKGKCHTCHVPPIFTEPGWNLHTPEELKLEGDTIIQANRGPEDAYRTTPLKGLWTHMKRGFFHDGRFKTLMEVINHYDTNFALGLTPNEQRYLIEYLKSL